MNYWRATLLLLTAGILYLSLTPSPPSDGLGWDKLNHAAAMSLVTVTAYLAARRVSRPVLFGASYAIALGVLVEVLQGACTTSRAAEWMDLVADVVGVGLAVLVLKVWPRGTAGADRS